MPLIRATHEPLLKGKERSFLVASVAVGASTVTVADYAQFTVGSYVLIGDFGKEGSEIIRLHTSTAPTSAGVVTLNSVLIYAHSVNDPIVQIDFNQVEFSRATTAAGAKSVLATNSIEADDLLTVYNDTTNSTGYAFVRYKNSATTTYSSYSGPMPYTGLTHGTVRVMKDQGLALTHESISELITEEFLLDELNNWQDDVTDQHDWSFELVSGTTTLATSTTSYTLPTDWKFTDSNQSTIQIRPAYLPPLQYVDKREYDLMQNAVTTSPTGTPTHFTIWDGSLLVSPTPTSDDNGDTLNYDYYKVIPRLVYDTDITEIPFPNVSQFYLAWKIEARKKNKDQADYWRQMYENRMMKRMKRNRTGQEARFYPII